MQVKQPSSSPVGERRKGSHFTVQFLLTLRVLAYSQRQTTLKTFHNLKTQAMKEEHSWRPGVKLNSLVWGKSSTGRGIRTYSSGFAMNTLYDLGGNHLRLLGFSFFSVKNSKAPRERILKCPCRQYGTGLSDRKSSSSSNIFLSKTLWIGQTGVE